MKITWLGHASFRIEIEDAVLLIDPWLAGNPSFADDQRALIHALPGVDVKTPDVMAPVDL